MAIPLDPVEVNALSKTFETPFRYLSLAIPFTYLNDLMRHAALGTSTIFSDPLEYTASILLSTSMLLIGQVAFNKIEKRLVFAAPSEPVERNSLGRGMETRPY